MGFVTEEAAYGDLFRAVTRPPEEEASLQYNTQGKKRRVTQ